MTYGKLSLENLKQKLEYYCSYQERCHKDIKDKLYTLKAPYSFFDEIIVHLISHNYLNEERFAKSFVSGKFTIKKWGKQRLISELRKRQISKINIKIAINQIDPEEYLKTFNALAEKKANTITENNTLKKKKKLTDYLQYRGWETDLVYNKVNELIK